MGNPVSEGYETTVPMELDIDIDHIEKGIQDLIKYRNAVNRGIEKGQLRLAELMKAKAIENLTMYGLGGSSIANSISVNTSGDGISLIVGSDYAVYVEYGTGIVGSANPHPSPSIAWAYDVNGHGESGWWYPTTSADPNPYKSTKDGQLYGWTKGQASRPFMYKTWEYGNRVATRVIRSAIRKEVKASLGGK